MIRRFKRGWIEVAMVGFFIVEKKAVLGIEDFANKQKKPLFSKSNRSASPRKTDKSSNLPSCIQTLLPEKLDSQPLFDFFMPSANNFADTTKAIVDEAVSPYLEHEILIDGLS